MELSSGFWLAYLLSNVLILVAGTIGYTVRPSIFLVIIFECFVILAMMIFFPYLITAFG